MQPPFHTECRYHVQDGNNLCGAAVAMMILDQQGVSLVNLDQVTLDSALVKNTPQGVATTPDNLAAVLNSKLPNKFRVVSAASDMEVARHVVRSVMRDVPAAVPITADNHWTVVEGIGTNVIPTANQSYEVSDVWVHNPTTTPVTGVPPHLSADGCNTFGAVSIQAVWYDFRSWLSLVDQTKDNFRLKCVVSSDPTDIGFPSAPSPLPPFMPSFNESLAEDFLLHALKSDGLGKAEIVSRLSPSGQIRAKSLGLVRGIAEQVSDYFLVSASDDRGIIGLAKIDAKRPWMRSFGILGSPQERVVPNGEEILQSLLEANVPGLSSNSADFWSSQLKTARLVWRPCVESHSPFTPFLAVPLGSNFQPQRHAFVRFTIDKTVFLELTDPLQGG